MMAGFDKAYELSIKEQYDEYLDKHCGGVEKGYKWICENLLDSVYKLLSECAYFEKDSLETLDEIISMHDASKFDDIGPYGKLDGEYTAYAKYFYGGEKTDDVNERFDLAWLHHQHNNPHHWQYWILQNDEDGKKILDMPAEFIIEMICDHWSFSWNKGDLHEVFNWYKKNKDKMIMSDKTRERYENFLKLIEDKLDESDS